MANISLTGITKRYAAVDVIRNVSLEVQEGAFTVIVGPSGCGKSTLLRIIAGLEELSAGEVRIGGRLVNDVDASDRGVAMVFQSYALYPHMTVADNMSFSLRMVRTPKAEIARRVAHAADVLKITPLLDRKPKQLSGGQRQRVAIGRAIVRDPKVFLFDEPLSNLDADLRVQMRVEIARLHKRLGNTMVYVTHDQTEAMTLATQIVVMRAGVVEQVGSPMGLYTDPDNSFVAGFIGTPRMNFLPGTVEPDGQGIRLGDGTRIAPWRTRATVAPGTAVTIGIRPEHVDPEAADFEISAELDVVENLGGTNYLHTHLPGGETFVAERRGFPDLVTGNMIRFGIAMSKVLVFGPDGARLR